LQQITAAIVLILATSGAARAQQRLAPVADNLTATEVCRKCHFRRPGERREPEFAAPDGFCAEVEATIWTEQDKHRQSLYLLVEGKGGELTRRILGFDLKEILSITTPTGTQGKKAAELLTAVQFRPDADPARVAAARECFACHAPIPERREGEESTTFEYGVSCQACHGPGFLYENPHKDKIWRVVRPDTKEQVFGMRNLRHPVRRAALCSSCHVGSFSDEWKAAPGDAPRFVKHEWYAKGHPPLPGLEFATFSRYMPAHWKRLQEKPLVGQPFAYAAQGPPPPREVDRFIQRLPLSDEGKNHVRDTGLAESYLAANQDSLFSSEPAKLMADSARTRDVLVSAVAVLGNYASLLHQAPQSAQRDFALYDCSACHHELRSRFPTTSRVRRSLAPGRPPPAFWTLVLARRGLALLPEKQTAFEASVQSLEVGFSQQPLGNWEEIAPAAHEMARLCAALGQELVKGPLDHASRSRLLSGLVATPDDADRDFHAARQLAWAIREILRDQAQLAYGDENSPVSREIDERFGKGPWQGDLRLKLPAGQEETVTGHLRESLEALANFDPQVFRALLDAAASSEARP
jgi:hypothetical protein